MSRLSRPILFCRRLPVTALALMAALVLAAGLTLAPRPALAHALLVESTLPKGPVPPDTPMPVMFRFNAALEQSFFKAVLIGPGKERRDLETKPGKDKTEEIVMLPGLKPGKYALSYNVLAADSHLTDGLIRFAVAPK